MKLIDSPVAVTLLVANVLISLWAMFVRRDYYLYFAEKPYEIVHNKKYYQLITSAFLHADLFHLTFNMLALFSFGTYLESFFVTKLGPQAGSLYFAIIYFVSLLTGSLLTTIFHFRNPHYIAVGASGAISGIIFSFILFFPKNQILIFFIPMPAYMFAFLYIIISVIGMKSKFGNIGHEAHLGGAIGGLIATFLLVDKSFSLFLSYFS
ncbi:MAG: rhomboid family intramembrane serine protease [Ignavibacteria bacterium]